MYSSALTLLVRKGIHPVKKLGCNWYFVGDDLPGTLHILMSSVSCHLHRPLVQQNPEWFDILVPVYRVVWRLGIVGVFCTTFFITCVSTSMLVIFRI